MRQLIRDSRTILKVIHIGEKKKPNEELIRLQEKMQELQKEIDRLKAISKNEQAQIKLCVSGQIHFICKSEISYCQASGNYTTIYKSDGSSILVSRTLKSIEKLITGGDMVRCHQSYLVNWKFVAKYAHTQGVWLKGVTKVIPVSRRMRPYVLARIAPKE